MLRLAHVSDIHLYTPARWGLRDWLSKRVAGWVNSRLLTRGRAFRHAADTLRILVEDIHARKPDLLIFSGDASTLGFGAEFDLAAKLLRVGEPSAIPCLAVPGNHDYYTPGSVKEGAFERAFAPALEGERVDGATYPFARRVGPIWLIGLNSCIAHHWMWDASGRVGGTQLERLRRLLARPHIAAAPRVLVTHYPIQRPCGSGDYPWRNLRDVQATLEVAGEGGVSLWLHGHCHRPYHLLPPAVSIPSVCAGSGTQRGLWTYVEHSFDGETWSVERRRFQPDRQCFETCERFEFPFTAPATGARGVPANGCPAPVAPSPAEKLV